jgi:hypothetical protein
MRKFITSTSAVLLAFFCSFSGKTASAQCSKTGYFPKGGSITLDSNYNAGGYSFWFYEMITDFTNGLSHTNFLANPVCVKNAIGGTYTKRFDTTLKKIVFDTTIKNNISVGKDGSDKPLQHHGIKSEQSGGKKDTVRIWFRLDKTYEKGIMPVKVKYSTKFDSTSVCGPNSACAVPVTWHKTSATIGDGVIIINFSTATELNNEKFEVERSSGDGNFIKIGEIAGAGNSSQILQYQFVDNNPLPGKNYYRIKQIDFNGTSDYTKPFWATLDPNPGLEIYPNPANANDMVTLNAFGFEKGSDHKITIHDGIGKIIIESVFTGSGNILYINLAKGVYQITATGKDAMNRDIIFRKRLIVH